MRASEPGLLPLDSSANPCNYASLAYYVTDANMMKCHKLEHHQSHVFLVVCPTLTVMNLLNYELLFYRQTVLVASVSPKQPPFPHAYDLSNCRRDLNQNTPGVKKVAAKN